MKRLATLFLLGCSSAHAYGTPITPNLSAVKAGPICGSGIGTVAQDHLG